MVLIQKTLSQSIDSIALSYTCKYMILNNLHHSSQSIHSIIFPRKLLRNNDLYSLFLDPTTSSRQLTTDDCPRTTAS